MSTQPLGGVGGFFEGLFDAATGAYQHHIDRASIRHELALAREQREALEAEARTAEARRNPSQAAAAGIDQNTILMLGGALVAALVVARL